MILNATNIGRRINGLGRHTLFLAHFFVKKPYTDNVVINKNALPFFSGSRGKLKVIFKYCSPDYKFIGHLLRLIYTNTIVKPLFNTSQLEVSFWNKKQVVVVHDLIPLLFPELHKKQYYYFKYILPFVLKYKTRHIIAVSHHTKELLLKYYALEESSITVIYNGTDHEYKFNPVKKEDFILYVGRPSHTKNIARLIEAFIIYKNNIPCNTVLKLVGFTAAEYKVPDRQDIEIVGVVTDEYLDELYYKAKVLVLPSLYEGFGFPALEAMSRGTAVVASNVSSLPEICGENAMYIDPENTLDIAEKIQLIMGDEKLRLALEKKGPSRAKLFSWERSLQDYDKVLQKYLIFPK